MEGRAVSAAGMSAFTNMDGHDLLRAAGAQVQYV